MGVFQYKTNNNSNYLNMLINVMLITMELILLLLSSLAYVIQNRSDLANVTEGLALSFPIIIYFGHYIILIFKKQDLQMLFHQFEVLIDSSKYLWI